MPDKETQVDETQISTIAVVRYHFKNYYCKTFSNEAFLIPDILGGANFTRGQTRVLLFRTIDEYRSNQYCSTAKISSLRTPLRQEGKIIPPELFHTESLKDLAISEVDYLVQRFQKFTPENQRLLLDKLNSQHPP